MYALSCYFLFYHMVDFKCQLLYQVFYMQTYPYIGKCVYTGKQHAA